MQIKAIEKKLRGALNQYEVFQEQSKIWGAADLANGVKKPPKAQKLEMGA